MHNRKLTAAELAAELAAYCSDESDCDEQQHATFDFEEEEEFDRNYNNANLDEGDNEDGTI